MSYLCVLYYGKPKLPTARLALHVNKTELNTSTTRSDIRYFAFSYFAITERILEVVDLSGSVIMIILNKEKILVLADLKSRGKMINIVQSFTFTIVTKRQKFSELKNVGFIKSKLY
jgi:hypothetical protein